MEKKKYKIKKVEYTEWNEKEDKEDKRKEYIIREIQTKKSKTIRIILHTICLIIITQIVIWGTDNIYFEEIERITLIISIPIMITIIYVISKGWEKPTIYNAKTKEGAKRYIKYIRR